MFPNIGAAVQAYVEANGFSVVRDYVGHGVGENLHESPEVPNYGKPGHGIRLQSGMVIAVEPMVNVGVYTVKVLPDGWTVKTRDGKLSAHYENTIAITDGEPEILTKHRRRGAVMSRARLSDIVLSLTGRDRGQLMLVVAEEGDFSCWRTDARDGRKTRKRKREKSTFPTGACDERTRLKLEEGGRLTNSEIRKALALWTGDEDKFDRGGETNNGKR